MLETMSSDMPVVPCMELHSSCFFLPWYINISSPLTDHWSDLEQVWYRRDEGHGRIQQYQAEYG